MLLWYKDDCVITVGDAAQTSLGHFLTPSGILHDPAATRAISRRELWDVYQFQVWPIHVSTGNNIHGVKFALWRACNPPHAIQRAEVGIVKGDSPLWVMRARSNSSAGGVGTLDLQPPAGCMWKVLYCVGYHDDNVAARACNWVFHDGVNASLVLGGNSAVTTGARVPLYSHGNPGAIPRDYTPVWWAEPTILTVG